MGETYKAWNGQDYPAPPPKGWYQASDQTWWPEGTGPGPAKSITADAPTQIPSIQNPVSTNSPKSTPAAEPTSKLPTVSGQSAPPGSTTPTVASSPNQFGAQPQTTPQAGSSGPADAAPGATQPGTNPAGQPNYGAQQLGQQPANRPAQQFDQQANQPGQGFGQQPVNQFGQRANPQGPPAGQNWSQNQQPSQKSSKGLYIGIAALGAFAFFAIVVGAIVLRSSEEPDQAQQVASTAEPATTVATTAPPTTAAPTTAEPTTTTVDSEVAVQQLRDHLVLIGVDSSDVSDSAIEFSATLTCALARIADTEADWAETRATEVESSIESQRDAGVDPLSEQQWSQFVDARLVFFCPEEAERLGVTL